MPSFASFGLSRRGYKRSKSYTNECKLLKWVSGDGATATLASGRALIINTPVRHNSGSGQNADHTTSLVVPTKFGDKVLVCFQNSDANCPSSSVGYCGSAPGQAQPTAFRLSLSIGGLSDNNMGAVGCKFIEIADEIVRINRREYVNNEKDEGDGQTFQVPVGAGAGLIKELQFQIPVDPIWGSSLDEIIINRVTETGEVTRFSATDVSYASAASLGANVGRSWVGDEVGTEEVTDGMKRSKFFVR